MLWDCYGRVFAGKYLGQVEADTAEEAKENNLKEIKCHKQEAKSVSRKL